MLQDKYLETKKLCDNISSLSDDEILALHKQTILNSAYYRVLELTVKDLANSLYGAFGTNANRYYLKTLAEDICAEGQFYIKLMDKITNNYFKNKWQNETEFIKELKNNKEFGYLIKCETIKEIDKDVDIITYVDTDSCSPDTRLITPNGETTIEDFYNNNIKNGSAGETLNGHESVKTNEKVLNWSNETKLYFGEVERIIRHKVTKPKWQLKTKSGKVVTMTSDHSMVVFRDGNQLTVKPSEVLKTDKILCVKKK